MAKESPVFAGMSTNGLPMDLEKMLDSLSFEMQKVNNPDLSPLNKTEESCLDEAETERMPRWIDVNGSVELNTLGVSIPSNDLLSANKIRELALSAQSNGSVEIGLNVLQIYEGSAQKQAFFCFNDTPVHLMRWELELVPTKMDVVFIARLEGSNGEPDTPQTAVIVSLICRNNGNFTDRLILDDNLENNQTLKQGSALQLMIENVESFCWSSVRQPSVKL